jgi:hypothetical protein
MSRHLWREILVVVVPIGAAAMLLAAAACSDEPGIASRSPTPRPGSVTPSPAVTSSSPSPSNAADYPNLSRFTDPFDRFAYKYAYSDCGLLGVVWTAETFGGDPDQPLSVARAYAEATFPQSVDHQAATLRGCLDAFEKGSR